jgi:hypothetical protein
MGLGGSRTLEVNLGLRAELLWSTQDPEQSGTGSRTLEVNLELRNWSRTLEVNPELGAEPLRSIQNLEQNP